MTRDQLINDLKRDGQNIINRNGLDALLTAYAEAVLDRAQLMDSLRRRNEEVQKATALLHEASTKLRLYTLK